MPLLGKNDDMIAVGLSWLFLTLSVGTWPVALPEAALGTPDLLRRDMAVTATPLPLLIGEATEPCETTASLPHAIVLSAQGPWEDALTNPATPGTIYLLRGGLYQATDKLWLKAGTADAPLIIKPYNCEAVTLQSSLRPNSYTVIAGLKIAALGIEDTKWAIRFDGKNAGAITNITLRNNTIVGGTIDAIRLTDAVYNVLLQGNHIDGGAAGHTIFVTAETAGVRPDGITITQNRLTKRYFDSAAEDMLQLRDVGAITITANHCTDGLNMEQCLDIKNATLPLLIAYNFFDGEQLHLQGNGADEAGGCMVIHESDGHPEQHIIEHNYFRHCKGTVIRFAPGTRDEQSSALLRYNLFVQQSNTDGIMPIEAATDLLFLNNTFIRGALKLGNSAQTRLPLRTIFQNNIFYQSAIEDNLPPSEAAYRCRYNLLYQLSGDGFAAAPCTHTIDADPRFIDLPHLNFHLQPGSPALGTGEAGTNLGALPLLLLFDQLTQQRYLPFVQQAE